MRRLGAIETSFGPFAQRAFSAAEIHVRAGAYIFRRGLDVCLAWVQFELRAGARLEGPALY